MFEMMDDFAMYMQAEEYYNDSYFPTEEEIEDMYKEYLASKN